MGGCATKLKVLKADGAEAPEPAPPAKEEAAGVILEAKEVEVVEEVKKVDRETVVDREHEIVDDDTVDEHGNKRRSLSNLFKENVGKESTEHEMQSDPVKEREPPVREKPTETKPHESGKVETIVEQRPTEDIKAPLEAEADKTIEVAPATGTSDEKAVESPPVAETQKPAKETQNPEEPEEKKVVEEKSDTLTQKPDSPEKKITEEEK